MQFENEVTAEIITSYDSLMKRLKKYNFTINDERYIHGKKR